MGPGGLPETPSGGFGAGGCLSVARPLARPLLPRCFRGHREALPARSSRSLPRQPGRGAGRPHDAWLRASREAPAPGYPGGLARGSRRRASGNRGKPASPEGLAGRPCHRRLHLEAGAGIGAAGLIPEVHCCLLFATFEAAGLGKPGASASRLPQRPKPQPWQSSKLDGGGHRAGRWPEAASVLLRLRRQF